MMKSSLKYLVFFLVAGLLQVRAAWPDTTLAPRCEPLELVQGFASKPVRYGKGILWRVSRQGAEHSYLFGTIHVADERILDLPTAVTHALDTSRVFVMEALPELEQAALFSNMMFFQDGNRLDQLVSGPVFTRTVAILKTYLIPEQVVVIMKPWAAYVTMNYPPQSGSVLDLELMTRASIKGTEIRGLETMAEQGEIFNKLSVDTQVRLLTDTVCHYDVVKNDFEEMKKFYLNRDTGGLYNYTNRYSITDEAVYQQLMNDLLTRRNHTMAERMQEILNKGNAFIAIGALHLPGDEGVLNLLDGSGYIISRIY
jgi:hypothetical protein